MWGRLPNQAYNPTYLKWGSTTLKPAVANACDSYSSMSKRTNKVFCLLSNKKLQVKIYLQDNQTIISNCQRLRKLCWPVYLLRIWGSSRAWCEHPRWSHLDLTPLIDHSKTSTTWSQHAKWVPSMPEVRLPTQWWAALVASTTESSKECKEIDLRRSKWIRNRIRKCSRIRLMALSGGVLRRRRRPKKRIRSTSSCSTQKSNRWMIEGIGLSAQLSPPWPGTKI